MWYMHLYEYHVDNNLKFSYILRHEFWKYSKHKQTHIILKKGVGWL